MIFTDSCEKIFNGSYFGAICLLLCCIPLPIKILSCKISSIVPKRNTIWIHHRDHKYTEIFPHKFTLFIFLNKLLYNSLTNKRALSFSRMLPGHDNNCLSVVFSSIIFFPLFTNYQTPNSFLPQTLSNLDLLNDRLICVLNFLNILFELAIRVWIGMSDK